MQMITPEKRFSDICGNIKSKITHKHYDIKQSHCHYYYIERFYNDNEMLMKYNSKSGILWCDYNLIWSVFESEYNMSFQQTQGFIKVQMEEASKPKVLTPQRRFSNHPTQMVEAFKPKVLIPMKGFVSRPKWVEEAFKPQVLIPYPNLDDTHVDGSNIKT